MLAGVDRLVEEVEEGLLPLVHHALAPQHQSRHGDHLCLEVGHGLGQIYTEGPQFLQFLAALQPAHQRVNGSILFRWIQYGRLRHLLPPHLIKVLGDAGHEAKLREEVGGVGAFLHLDLDLEEWLSLVFEGDGILLLEVVKHVEPGVDVDVAALLKDDADDLVVAHSRVVRHDYLVGQLLVYTLPDLFLVLPVVLFVEGIDEVQYRGLAHHLLDRVHPQEDALLEADEVGLVAVEELEVVEGGAFGGIKVPATDLAQLLELVLAHEALEAVVEEDQQQVRVLPHVEYLGLLNEDLVVADRVLLLLGRGLLQAVDVESTDHWIFYVKPILPVIFLRSGRIFQRRDCLRLRLSSIILGVNRTLQITILSKGLEILIGQWLVTRDTLRKELVFSPRGLLGSRTEVLTLGSGCLSICLLKRESREIQGNSCAWG